MSTPLCQPDMINGDRGGDGAGNAENLKGSAGSGLSTETRVGLKEIGVDTVSTVPLLLLVLEPSVTPSISLSIS